MMIKQMKKILKLMMKYKTCQQIKYIMNVNTSKKLFNVRIDLNNHSEKNHENICNVVSNDLSDTEIPSDNDNEK